MSRILLKILSNASIRIAVMRFLLAVFTLSCIVLMPTASAQTRLLPAKLGPLALERELEGEEARAYLNGLHAKSIAPATSSVAVYKAAGTSGMLYVSTYASPKKAQVSFDRMSRLMRGGNKTFSNHRSFRLGEIVVNQCDGLGQVHYYFHRYENVWWLSVDAPVATLALSDLLNHINSHRVKRPQ